ncbi:MAG TPA: insulinase family protein, partial [Gemmatimonadaceae bacterium]|nr:insulinase family protein [Gemmatimonadaceae bacterium]
LRAMWDQVRTVREDGIGAMELERARRIAEGRWLRRLEEMEGQANHLAEWEALGGWQLGDRYLERLLATTPEQVTDAARRWLDPAQASVIAYRPQESAAIAADADAMRAFLGGERPAALPASSPTAARTLPAVDAPVLEREEVGVRVYRTRRGLPILVRRKPGATIAHLGIQFVGGACEETDANAGITSLMARAAVKGTTTRTAEQIAEEAELLGGSIGPSAGSDSFGWAISVPTRHLAAAAELLADVTQAPVFGDEVVETERTAAIAAVVALRDDMYRYPMRLVTQAAFAGHAYGVPVSGTEESLARLRADALRDWHARQVRAGAAALAVVTDGEPDAVAAMLARAFEASGARAHGAHEAPRWPTERRERVERREKAQSALAIAFPSPSRDDDDRFAAAMIATVASGLGGRFFEELREKRSLCYTVQAFQSERRLAGSFVAYIATSPAQEAAARDGLLAEFAKLREHPVTAEELTRAQRYAIGVHAIRQQSGGAVLGDVLDAWHFGHLAELAEYEAQVRAVTPERMQAVARRYFDPAVRVEGVVRGA